MTEADWHHVEDLFHRCIALPAPEQRMLLALETTDIRDQVESLLAAEKNVEDLIDQPLADARAWLAEPAPSTPATTDGGALGSIGPYVLLRELGQGGFGTVFLAERRDGDFRLQVAIKQARPELCVPGIEDRLKLERRILARLDHPNIARLFDGGTDDAGRPYFVMEHIEGEPLDVYCDRRRLRLRQRLDLLPPIFDAVAFAHRRLVIHRDLKPSNILVTDDGTPKLFDFGIAKLLEEASGARSVTRTGLIPFTPEYASPEQVRGGDLTTTSDVYALGVLLYRLLTGQMPYDFPGPASPAQIERIIRDTPPRSFAQALEGPRAALVAQQRQTSQQALLRGIQGDLENITMMALRKEPERRYGSVHEMSDDLRRHLTSQPVLATGDSVAYVMGRFFRRHRLAVVSAVLVTMVLTLGLVTTVAQMRVAQRQQARAEQVIQLLVDDVFGSAAPERARGTQPTAREILDASVQALDRRLATSPDVHGTVLVAVGRLYQSLGAYDRAFEFVQRGHDLLHSFHRRDHPEVLVARSDLADIAFDLGNRELARDLLAPTIVQQRRAGRPERLALATSLHRLALIAHEEGRPEEAASALDEALRIRRRLHGDGSVEVAASLAVLAKLEFARGETAKADTNAREALRIRRQSLGPDHPDTLVSLNDSAVLVQARGDLETAESLLQEIVTVNERVHGPDHRNLANALANLGWVVGLRGRLDEAVGLIGDARRIHIRLFGEEHTSVITDNRNLARLHQRRQAWSVAESLLTANLTIARRQGEESLASARALLDFAALDFERAHYRDAARRYGDAAERLTRHLPAGDWRLVLPTFQRGRALRELGELSEAEPKLREAWRDFQASLGEDATRTLRARAELGLCLSELGRRKEAQEHLTPSLEGLRATLPADSPDLRWIEERLVSP